MLLPRCLVFGHYAVKNKRAMKLSSLGVENLGSLRQVVLDELPNLCIFVGKNGSGKSYIFNALQLFFSEFSVVGGASTVLADDYIWYRRETSSNIVIRAILKLTELEFKEFAHLAGLDEDDISADVKANHFSLEAVRELQFQKGWRTVLLKLGSHQLVEDDQLAQISTPSHELPDLSGWRLYLFDPGATADMITGSRLLTNLSTKIAYYSNPDFDALVASHGLPISEEFRGQNYEQWASSNGYTLVTRPPDQSEAKELFDAILQAKNKKIVIIMPEFADKLRTSFRIVPASRDSRESQHLRPPLLDQAQANKLRDLSLSRNVDDEAQWGSLGSDTERFLAKRLEPNPDQVLMRDKDMRLPLPQLGTGEQALLALEWYFLGPASIYAIEDPENHLHPDLGRRVLQLLRQKAARSQIFVSTHSQFFVNKEDAHSNWMVRMEDKQTVIDRCKDEQDLRNVLIELGVLPSDIFYRDLVVFVEGGTEKEAVIPIWADTLDVELKGNERVGIVGIGGESRLKDNLRIWLEVAKNAPADYLVILDSHSGGLPQRLNAERAFPSNDL